MKIKVSFEELDPIEEAGLRFLAGKDGLSVEEFGQDAILTALEGSEESATGEGYFERIREAWWNARKSRKEEAHILTIRQA
jgi:hypothetical protein